MDFGNNYIGGTMSEGYTCLFVFPFGIEIMYFNSDIQISFTIWPFNFTIGVGKNRTLFNG